MIVLIKITCIVLAIAIIALVLLQQGKGSDLGSAFGGGSSNSMFGALGPSDFLGKLTYTLVAIWLVLTLALAYFYKTQNSKEIFEDSLIEEVLEEEIEPSPLSSGERSRLGSISLAPPASPCSTKTAQNVDVDKDFGHCCSSKGTKSSWTWIVTFNCGHWCWLVHLALCWSQSQGFSLTHVS